MDYKTLGQKVVAMRQARGWSRRALSQHAGVSESTLKHMEDGERPDDVPYRPSPPTLLSVAKAFGVDGPELLEAYGEQAMADHLRTAMAPTVVPPPADDDLYDQLTEGQRRSLQAIFDELVKLIVHQPTPVGSNRAKGVYLHSVA